VSDADSFFGHFDPAIQRIRFLFPVGRRIRHPADNRPPTAGRAEGDKT